jgi:hypothetical protein
LRDTSTQVSASHHKNASGNGVRRAKIWRG